MFRVLQRPRGPRPVAVSVAAENAYWQYRTPLALVIDAARSGRLVDPGAEPFRPWDRGLPLPVGDHVHRYPSVFYSPYQLVALRAIEALAREMTALRTADERLRFCLDPLGPEEVSSLDGCRRLAVFLGALDSRYLPEIVLTIRHADAWEREDPAFDLPQRLALFGLDAEAFVATAEQLLAQAKFLDPLGRWYDLVRQAHPSTWADLRGAALLAMDYRIGAEVILRAVDDLGRKDLSNAPPRTGRSVAAVLDDRLMPEPALLDAALTDRGLSPHPALLLVLEGATEMLLMPRVLAQLYGEPVPPTLIDFVDMKTIDRDLDLLVRHELTPRLGSDAGEAVELVRPPTRVLVAVDPEKRFATREMQRAERQKLVRRLHESLPPAYRSPQSFDELATLIEVTTWGRLPWEFANFTDRELVRAIESCGAIPAGVSRDDVMASVRAERMVRTRSPNIESVGRSWPTKFRKVSLAEALWPRLEAKVARRIESGTLQRLPAARVALRALNMALDGPRRSVTLRVR